MSFKLDQRDVKEIMSTLGFNQYTKLQEKAFKEIGYGPGTREFIMGSTSSGKTLIPIVAYLIDRIKNKSSAKLLYIVPYRALATQKQSDFINKLRSFNLNIEISTSEYCKSDDLIKNGICDLAIVIYEKSFLFESQDKNFLSKYDYIVFDELGIIEHDERGAKCDFIFMKSCLEASHSVYVLATPYLNWDLYCEKYGFHNVVEKERPVELERISIEYKMPSKGDPDFIPGASYIEFITDNLLDICIKHYKMNHKILIFAKTRLEVQRLSHIIYNGLKDYNVIATDGTTLGECKQELINRLDMTYDDLYGLYDTPEDLFAYHYGIAYHNAALPEELRELIEYDFLRDNGQLKIVVSTETLAFGINSNVETVIITTINKITKKGDKVVIKKLSLNEYMNFTGRAGRMGKCQKGYVYTFVTQNQQRYLNKLAFSEANIHKVGSLYNNIISNSDMELHFLNYFNSDGISIEDLFEMISKYPIDFNQNTKGEIEKIIKNLLDRKLLYQFEDDFSEEILYKLTTEGKNLLGYVVHVDVYDELQNIKDDIISNSNIPLFDLLYKLSDVTGLHDIVVKDNLSLSKYAKHIPKMLNEIYEEKGISENCKKFIKNNKLVEKYSKLSFKENRKTYPSKDTWISIRKIAIAEALYKWCNGYRMYDICKVCSIQYGTLKRIAEKAKYFLDTIHTSMLVDTHSSEIRKNLLRLSVSLFYGIRPEILLHIDILNIEPERGRKLRAVGRAIYEGRRASKAHQVLKKHIEDKFEKEYVSLLNGWC